MTNAELISKAQGLLNDVRDYLDITWEDPGGDKKLLGIISRGIKRIDRIAGNEMDYSTEDAQRELLLDYCRYARSNALEDFEENFTSELLSLQISQEVKAREQQETQEQQENTSI